jgi:hypothetical protein
MLIACETSDIGSEIQPTEDKIAVKTDSFSIRAESVVLNNRYSESDKLLLGNYEDPIFGTSRLDFLAEFRYLNADYPSSAKATSVQVVLYYKTFFGDSTAVQEATVYQLDKPLIFEENYTSDIKVEDFCDKKTILGKKVYVAYDPTIPQVEDNKGVKCNTIRIDLPLAMGEKLVADRSINENQDNFLNFIKGIYVTNEYRGQVVLDVDSVNLEVGYEYAPVETKPDSLISEIRVYPLNKETTGVLRVSNISAPDVDAIPDSLIYLSSYTGMVPKVEIPIDRIRERLGFNKGDIISINNMSLILERAICSDSSATELGIPGAVILIRESDIEKFFTQSLYPADGIYTALGMYEAEIGAYRFDNLADYLHYILYMDTEESEINPFYVLPVTGAIDVVGTDAVIRHQFRPSGVRLRSPLNPNSNMRLSITYTKL